MLGAPKAALSDGGPSTVRVAVLLTLPAPLSLDEIGPVVSDMTPEAAAVTLTLNVHEPLAARVAPEKPRVVAPAGAVTLPVQVLTNPLGDEIVSPAGRLSLTLTPVTANPLFGFVIAKVSDVEPPTGMFPAPNAITTVGALAIVSVAEAVLPVPPFVELTALVVSAYCPEYPIAFTVTVHELFAATEPPVKLTELPPATAVAVPPQVFTNPLGVATQIPDGNEFVKAAPVSAELLAAGFVNVNVSVLVPFTGIVVGLNAAAMDNGASTARLAEAVPPAPPSVELTAPVVLFFCPAEVPVTFTVNVHELLCASAAPLRLATFVPCIDVIVPPPQLPVSPFGALTTSPAGNVSVNAMPLKLCAVLLF